MKGFGTADDVRREVERHVGSISDAVWDLAVSERYVSECLDGASDDAGQEDTMNRLVGYIRELKKIEGQPRTNTKRTAEREIPADRRLETLSRILTVGARRLPAVAEFRRDVLNDRLLDNESVPNWIHEQALAQGPVAKWVTFCLPTHVARDPVRPWAFIDAVTALAESEKRELAAYGISWSAKTLAYAIPGRDYVLRVAVNPGGTLWKLKQAVDCVKNLCDHWSEESVTQFVLTDRVPLIPLAKITVSSPQWNKDMPPGPPRLILSLDPRLSGTEVQKIYSDSRKIVFSGRDRPMTDKHLALAVFHAETVDDGSTWNERLYVWNQQHKAWTYDPLNVQNFARDCISAFKRVTGADAHQFDFLGGNSDGEESTWSG